MSDDTRAWLEERYARRRTGPRDHTGGRILRGTARGRLGRAAAVAAIAARNTGAAGSFVNEFSLSLSLDGASVSVQNPSWWSIAALFFIGLAMLLVRNLFRSHAGRLGRALARQAIIWLG